MRRNSSASKAKRIPQITKAQLRNTFEDFFERQYKPAVQILDVLPNELTELRATLPNIFVETLELKNLQELNVASAPEAKNPARLKTLLAAIAVFFEQYDCLLVVNAQKTRSFVDYLEHLKNLSSSFGEAQLDVRSSLSFFAAFGDLLAKKLKLLANILEYLKSKKTLSLVVEKSDFGKSLEFAKSAERLGVFEILAAKGELKRRGRAAN